MRYLAAGALLTLTHCAPSQTNMRKGDAVDGPDKQFEGGLLGAATGAGAGAVTGFQVGASTGPGALVGAGLGAVAGGIRGAVQDKQEDQLLELSARTSSARQVTYAQELLKEHYARRLELHPTRDIFPADWFFDGDSSTLLPHGRAILYEVAGLNERRAPWSRLQITVYNKSRDTATLAQQGPEPVDASTADASSSEVLYGKRLAERRAQAIGDCLVRAGIEPRRLQAQAVLVPDPVLIDPHDRPDRYSQAVELNALDR